MGEKQPSVEIENGKYVIYWKGEHYAGPFQFAYILDVEDNEVVYTEQRSGDFYLHWGDHEYGPFEEVTYEGVFQSTIFMTYRVSGQYYVQWGRTAGPYAAVRYCRYEDVQVKCEVRSGRAWTHITLDNGKL
ncbi:MAG: hypothetical protein ABIG32_00840 [Candidatus Uhrbacteria bacterium]|nr:hypothetical protein [Patescibacteria group bacterium]MBU1907110.1 hypothetical protein [Patescibacteria group bacterium]